MNTDLVNYYSRRAPEYEAIYKKPERQQDIAAVFAVLQNAFVDKHVLEIGCGTGFWTEKIAEVAKTVHATDINQSVIDIAQQKHYGKADVLFEVADLFKFAPAQQFESLFGGFIWSHILLQEIDRFVTTINRFVVPAGRVVLIDNNFVPGSNLPVTHTDAAGNTYQTRKLADGSRHLVLKNFPSVAYLKNKLEVIADDVSIVNLQYYWAVTYKTKA